MKKGHVITLQAVSFDLPRRIGIPSSWRTLFSQGNMPYDKPIIDQAFLITMARCCPQSFSFGMIMFLDGDSVHYAQKKKIMANIHSSSLKHANISGLHKHQTKSFHLY